MTTKLLLEFAFVIFLLQVFRLKTYFTPFVKKQEKYNNSRVELEKLLGKNIVNMIFIIILIIFSLIYIGFYSIGFEVYKGTYLIYFSELMIALTLYELIHIIIEEKRNKLRKSFVIDKLMHPMISVYLVYFVYYVLR